MAKAISFAGLLPSDRIVVGLKGKSYEDAVGRLLDRLAAAELISDRAVLDALVAADSAGEVPTLGGSALLVHYRTDAVRELALAIGTSTAPFAFTPADAPEARFMALIVAPRSAAKYYLKTVAALSRLLREADVATSLVEAKSAKEVLAIIREHDVVIQPDLMVQDLMSRRVHSVSPDTPLSEVVRLMVRHRRRAVPVVNDSKEVIGLVTQQEVLQHFLPQLLGTGGRGAEQARIEDAEVRDLMQRSVMCFSEDQLISEVLATTLSQGGAAHFPVVKEGRLVGFLSLTDLIQKIIEPSV